MSGLSLCLATCKIPVRV